MGQNVVTMHFVCRDNLNVKQLSDGNFESGIWKVAMKWRNTVKTVALHQDRNSPSYRQGKVIGTRVEKYNGMDRMVFTIRPTSIPLEWHGTGTGEKGYRYE